jgi:hypothetical protein
MRGAGRRDAKVLTRVELKSMADEDVHLSAFLPNDARLAEGEPDAEGEPSTRLLRFVGLTAAAAAGAGDCSKYAPNPGELSSDADPENDGEGAIVGRRDVGAGESMSIPD